MIGAGVFANLALAWALLFVTATTYGVTVTELRPEPSIVAVVPGSAAALAGLRAGDVLLGVDGVPLALGAGGDGSIDDAISKIKRGMAERDGVTIQLLRPTPKAAAGVAGVAGAGSAVAAGASTASRPVDPLGDRAVATPPTPGGERLSVTVTVTVANAAAAPAAAVADGRTGAGAPAAAPARTIGVKLDRTPIRTSRNKPESPLAAARAATSQTQRLSTRIASELTRALGGFVSKAVSGLSGASAGGADGGAPSPKLEGPVGILGTAINLAGSDTPEIFAAFIATISLNIAVFNTLPVPGLDGGQMAFLALDAVADTVGVRRVDKRVKEGVGALFALLLSVLALSVLATDLGRAAGLVK